MNKPTITAAIVLILVTVLYVIFRQPADKTNDPDQRSGNRAGGIHAEQPLSSSNNGPSAKSGDRNPRTKPKTITTDSGLQYEVLVEGTGPNPGPTDTVKVHYHGTTVEGVVFDSTIDRGRPTMFPLDRVIKGWGEGLQFMQAGAKFRFTIPPDLAYGEKGAGDKIGPNETLIFEVELLEIKPKR